MDELIVIDKSSTDATPEISKRYADKYLRVPWSPTVEETRDFAVEQCSHDFIVCLDDDECLNAAATEFIRTEANKPKSHDVYLLPMRHFILGRHDERAYYWPEYKYRVFKRGALSYTSTVHGVIGVNSADVFTLPSDSPAFIYHLSHKDVETWVEKTNRYTSQPDRASSFSPEQLKSISEFSKERLDFWLQTVKEPDNYLESIAVLRGIYDIVDGLKTWEKSQPDGAENFAEVCSKLSNEHDSIKAPPRPKRSGLFDRLRILVR